MKAWKFEELRETPSQTGGPYVHIGLLPKQSGIDVFEYNFNNDLLKNNPQGQRIRLEGQVFDGLGIPLRDVLVEIWQADANGVYPSAADFQAKTADQNFHGWGRSGADFSTGVWSFETIKPGPVPGRKGTIQAPHINLIIFARGINMGLHTRVYFEDEREANTKDPILNSIEWQPRRQTLMAKPAERDGQIVYRFDIYIQGDKETVFLDL